MKSHHAQKNKLSLFNIMFIFLVALTSVVAYYGVVTYISVGRYASDFTLGDVPSWLVAAVLLTGVYIVRRISTGHIQRLLTAGFALQALNVCIVITGNRLMTLAVITNPQFIFFLSGIVGMVAVICIALGYIAFIRKYTTV